MLRPRQGADVALLIRRLKERCAAMATFRSRQFQNGRLKLLRSTCPRFLTNWSSGSHTTHTATVPTLKPSGNFEPKETIKGAGLGDLFSDRSRAMESSINAQNIAVH